MTEFFDTHAHFEGSLEETRSVLSRAASAGVTRIMAVGGSDSLNNGVNLAAQAGVPGLKIWKCLGWDRDQVGKFLSPINYDGISAVGEIGLDYHYSPETRKAQLDLFAAQLDVAQAGNLPVVIHTRDADDDTLGVLKEIPSRGIIHCFTGSVGFCRKLLDLGFMISISGIVTFRAADNVRAAALSVPDDRLLIETDSPFLAPAPLRGKVNEPSFLVNTAKFLAELRGISLENLAATTTQNALNVLGEK